MKMSGHLCGFFFFKITIPSRVYFPKNCICAKTIMYLFDLKATWDSYVHYPDCWWFQGYIHMSWLIKLYILNICIYCLSVKLKKKTYIVRYVFQAKNLYCKIIFLKFVIYFLFLLKFYLLFVYFYPIPKTHVF